MAPLLPSDDGQTSTFCPSNAITCYSASAIITHDCLVSRPPTPNSHCVSHPLDHGSLLGLEHPPMHCSSKDCSTAVPPMLPPRPLPTINYRSCPRDMSHTKSTTSKMSAPVEAAAAAARCAQKQGPRSDEQGGYADGFQRNEHLV